MRNIFDAGRSYCIVTTYQSTEGKTDTQLTVKATPRRHVIKKHGQKMTLALCTVQS